MRRCRRALLISFYERFLQSFQMCGPRGQRPLFRAVQGIRDISGVGYPLWELRTLFSLLTAVSANSRRRFVLIETGLSQGGSTSEYISALLMRHKGQSTGKRTRLHNNAILNLL